MVQYPQMGIQMLDIAIEQKNLIEKLIRSDAKYYGNEDLFDDFFNESFKRSCHVLNGVKEVTSIEGYLRKVVQTSILSVLKDLGRVRRLSRGYVSEQREIPISAMSVTHAKQEEEFSYDINYNYNSDEELIVNQDLLRNIIDIIFQQNILTPQKQYLEIFKLRYKENKKQNEIAEILSLSQSEVSKRLVEISKLVKEKIDN